MRRLPETFKFFGYTPYGCSIDSDARVCVAFNGERRDPLGFYHLGRGHRVYSCSLMRFFSADSLSPFSRGGINAYTYCAGDPVNFSDPGGTMRRSTIKVAPGTAGKKKVTWGDGDPVNPSLISGPSSYGARAPQKSILRVKSIGDTKMDEHPPAEPMNYDVLLMTESEINTLQERRALYSEKRLNHKWNSVGYREADAELKRIRRLVNIEKGIRQDRGWLELTKPEYRYGGADDYLRYPKEPDVDYE